MICYRDMTFCPFWEECRKGKTCPRALTEKVREEAKKWWAGNAGDAPIMQYTTKPSCYVK
jgi:hypothetical protein